MKRNLFYFITFILFSIPMVGNAQIFSDDDWEEEKTMIMGKWSQLFYELNVGINVDKGRYNDFADFVYISIGYGKPNTENAWRKFLPNSQQAAPGSKEEMMNRTDDNTSGLHAGTIGLGWQHFFNHVIGFHIQAGWGFIADFGSGTSSSTSTTTSTGEEEVKKTFIYNSVPVQAGLDLNLWKNLNLQVGVTYMWKEIPIITVGIGAAF